MRLTVALVAVLLLVVGCAGASITPAVVAPGDRSINMKASDFKFDPGVIQTTPGELLLRVENVSGTAHNITVKDPGGNTLVNAELPAKTTTNVTVRLEKPGSYPFHCAKPGHTTMGMKGKIEVAGS